MAEIKAFKALRFTEKAGELVKNLCPPYDIISPAERESLISESAHNTVRLELPVGENAYAGAAKLLGEWLSEGMLAEDSEEGLYVYEEEFTAHGERKKIKGLICLVKLEEFSKGIILPHEDTLSKAKEDRLNLMKACGCNFSQIYSMYIDPEKRISGATDRVSMSEPAAVAKTDDGIVHRLWISRDKAENDGIIKAFADKQLYIADGHHRYETALNYRNYLRSEGIAVEGDKADYVMMFLIDIDDDGLVIFPTHRLIHGLSGFNAEKVIDGASDYFEVEKIGKTEDIESCLAQKADKKAFAFYSGGEGCTVFTLKKNADLSSNEKTRSDAYRDLDVTALHSLLLERVLGIDKDNMARQINLTYTRSFTEAIDGVNNGDYQCAFILNPTRIGQIKDVAAAGDRMPQKSTYFYPKLITGMVMNKIL